MQDCITKEERMSSVEIANITGMDHEDLMKTIQESESSWISSGHDNFSLKKAKNAFNRNYSFYDLTLEECLHFANQLNYKARVKMLIRWLEIVQKRNQVLQTNAIFAKKLEVLEKMNTRTNLLLELMYNKISERINSLEEKLTQPKEITIKIQNEKRNMTITEISKDLSLTPAILNEMLRKKEVQTKATDHWELNEPYQNQGLTETKKVLLKGRFTKTIMYWTNKGRSFISAIIEHGLSPMEALEHVNKNPDSYQPKQLTINILRN